MSKELVVFNADKFLAGLGTLNDDLMTLIKDGEIEEIVRRKDVASVYAVMAQKVKDKQYITAAKTQEVTMARAVGEALMVMDRAKKGRPGKTPGLVHLSDFNVSTQDASRWVQMASLPQYAFDHVLTKDVPSVNMILSEHSKMLRFKELIKEAGVSSSKLKNFILKDYTIMDVMDVLGIKNEIPEPETNKFDRFVGDFTDAADELTALAARVAKQPKKQLTQAGVQRCFEAIDAVHEAAAVLDGAFDEWGGHLEGGESDD